MELDNLINSFNDLLNTNIIDDEYEEYQSYRWLVGSVIKLLGGDIEASSRFAKRAAKQLDVFTIQKVTDSMLSIPKGANIIIETRDQEYDVIVSSANNYGTPDNPNWYIECNDRCGIGLSRYYKQDYDGGKVRLKNE